MTTQSQQSQPITLLTLVGVDEVEFRRARLAELAAGIVEMRRCWAIARTLDDAAESAPQHPHDDADET